MFYPPELITRVQANVAKYDWARQAKRRIIRAAAPWRKMSDEALWSLMFGATIQRSWMVWSNGHCPSCKEAVPMYNWRIDALAHPWKLACPHCGEFFPKNDFGRFHASGLDAHGVFCADLADRSLLFNTAHPDPADPLHTFGVDDGTGYREGEKRWLFVGTYLVYGQWKQLVVGGIVKLSDAFLVTGDPLYAHKTAVLLDRVADLYPTFDFGTQAILYEQKADRGYVSTWHDACVETCDMVLAWDKVRDALDGDEELVAFLSDRAARFMPRNRKDSIASIRRNVESRLLRDVLRHPHKIRTNFPVHELCSLIIRSVLGWPAKREQILRKLDRVLKQTTAVDGVTGEKGLMGYTSYTIAGVAAFLERYARVDPGFLPELLARHPRLALTYRFHIDTKCLGRYYPLSGDCGWFAGAFPEYVGVRCTPAASLGPSLWMFLWRLYELTGDDAYVQTLYHENGAKLAGLPYDLTGPDPEAFQKKVDKVIRRAGPEPRLGSVNKDEWHLGILRSGSGREARALWLDYDSGYGHGHFDAMNLGLFAKGLDLMPDLGYPPVNYGGWNCSRANWYRMAASHNTVVVDGTEWLGTAGGRTTLWAAGPVFQAIRASAAGIAGTQQFERTAALVDVSDTACYVLDLFRVVGGREHARFLHSHFGAITTEGLSLHETAPWGAFEEMRDFRVDPAPAPGWSVDWTIDDRYKLLRRKADVHLRCTDLTAGAQVLTCEGWVSSGGAFTTTEFAWIPRLLVLRQNRRAPLGSTFVSIIEPWEKRPAVAGVRRLALKSTSGRSYPEANVALEVTLADGRRDLFVAADVENPLRRAPSVKANRVLLQKDSGLRLEGELAWVRLGPDGAVRRMALCRARALSVGGTGVRLREKAEHVQIDFTSRTPRISGIDPAAVEVVHPEIA